MVSEKEALEIMKQCPRFYKCCAPVCPLDLNQAKRNYHAGEELCELGKTYRVRIGKGTALPRQGMTVREWGGHQAWQRKTVAQRKATLSRLEPFFIGKPPAVRAEPKDEG